MRAQREDLIPTRRSLLERLRDWDDQESWRTFFETYWRLIHAVAIRAGLTDAEAQEVVQETVILVAKKMPGFQYDPARGSFRSWLLHTTQWRIADQFRKRRRQPPPAPDPTDRSSRTARIEQIPDPAGPALQAVWDEEWERSVFAAALARVKHQASPKQYQIFDLYVLKEWPAHKVAQALGVSRGQIYVAKHRVARLLKKEVRSLQTQLR
jgi:RNA polymerase sigma-70 factor (ECF subfamily)